jgi:two-component system, cell cycle response regulator
LRRCHACHCREPSVACRPPVRLKFCRTSAEILVWEASPVTGPPADRDFDDLTLVFQRAEVRQPDPAGDCRMPAIILYDGDEIGGLHSLTKDETVIGRTAGADIVIPDSSVSRRHAVIRRAAPGVDDFEVIDLGSTNGTIVEGERVERLALKPGSKVAIGGRILKFELVDKTDLAYQAHIVQMIHLDELTGLLTRRSLFRALEAELIRTERYQHPVSLLMMDLDHFKLVNDTHGHVVGSHCLSEVGALIREATRVTDVNGRYGGEEFVSFLPETDTAAALMMAERIREALAETSFEHGGTTYQVRISIGVATYPADGANTEALVRAADTALYRAKAMGRNRSVVAGSRRL